MIAPPGRPIFAVLLLAIGFCACSRKDPSPFQYETRSLQAVWASDAELKYTEVPRRSENGMLETWWYQFASGPDAAVKLFRSHIPAGYKLVRQDAHEAFGYSSMAGSYQRLFAPISTTAMVAGAFPLLRQAWRVPF